jgi:hypothetical protein
VTIAGFDSEVDKRHTELQRAISKELDTLNAKKPPHSRGTAMVGPPVDHAGWYLEAVSRLLRCSGCAIR